ncbi:MAG TPA: FAD-dependent oxidoreductase, partial [Terricaulis sp.]|nr:FAD-dependent oxidoreductase [Terricaulis sp.]
MTKRDGARVIIIGAGFSGSATAAQLLRRGRRVTLIERNAAFGPGLAYGEAAGEHLLNVVAARMSAFPEVPTHFVAWLERRLGGDWAERFGAGGGGIGVERVDGADGN